MGPPAARALYSASSRARSSARAVLRPGRAQGRRWAWAYRELGGILGAHLGLGVGCAGREQGGLVRSTQAKPAQPSSGDAQPGRERGAGAAARPALGLGCPALGARWPSLSWRALVLSRNSS